MFRKIISWLFMWDGVWTIPLAFLLFLLFGRFGEWYWGEGFGAMTPEFFHSILFAAIVVVALNFISWLGMWFNFNGIFQYYFSRPDRDFNSLTPFQKICVVLFVYSLFFISGLLVIVNLV